MKNICWVIRVYGTGGSCTAQNLEKQKKTHEFQLPDCIYGCEILLR